MSIRLNPNIYSTAEPNITSMPDDEKKAVLQRDTTKAKEEIIFYRERSQDLMVSLKAMASKMVVDRDKCSKEMVDEHSRVDELRNEIKIIEKNSKAVQDNFEENAHDIEEDFEKAVEELQGAHNSRKQRLQKEIGELQEKIADLVEFEEKEVEYQTKLEDLSRKRDYEMTRINRKEDIIRHEEKEYHDNKDYKEIELNKVETEKNECEILVKVGSKELEKKKVDNQNRIDVERRVAQQLAEKNKGKSILTRIAYGSPCVERLRIGVSESQC